MAKSTKKTEQETKSLFNIYGARVSKSGKYANISIVKNTGDDREFETIPVDIEGKKVAVKVDKDFVYLKIKRLDVETDDVDVF